MGEEKPPEGGGGNPADGGDEPQAVDPKSKAIKAGAVGALGVGGIQGGLLFSNHKSFGVGKLFRTTSSMHAAAIAPVAYIQETKVEKANTMRGELNKIREEHGRFSGENDALSNNIDALQVETSRMNECAEALNDIANTQNADLEKLMALIEENRKITREMRKIMKKKALEEVVNIVIESDSDMDFTVGGGNELEELVLHLKEVPDLDFNEDKFRKVVNDNDGDMRLVLKCIFSMMPDNEDMRASPDENECEPIIFDDVADAHEVSESALKSFDRNILSSPTRGKDNAGILSPQSSIAPAINFLDDSPDDMTRGRRFALKHMNSRWYYPAGNVSPKGKKDDTNEGSESEFHDNPTKSAIKSVSEKSNEGAAASLAQAWAFFEHNTLPRYLFEPKPPDWERKGLVRRAINKMSKANKQMDRAEPGESNLETRLYSPQFTPLTQMGDFGIGVGLYFSTLRFLTILTLVAGLINIPVISFFASNEYSGGQPTITNPFLKGSAICTDTKWVLCRNCFGNSKNKDRLANSTTPLNLLGKNETNYIFAKKNNCNPGKKDVGYISYGAMWFIALGVIVMEVFQKNMEIKFDEDEQTTQDYSIKVLNPPGDAKDPEEWKDFFEGFYDDVHVTCCTVGIDNQELLSALMRRRELHQKIRYALPLGEPMDLDSLAKKKNQIVSDRNCFQRLKAKAFPGIPEWFTKMRECDSTIYRLSKEEYFATCVFVTFETEDGQRRVLSSMSKKEFLFRSEHKLSVEEADEPSSVMWLYLNTRKTDKIKVYFNTYIAHVASLVASAALVIYLKRAGSVLAPAVIAISNQFFPRFALFLTNYEKHESRDSLEVSLYIKIVVFRWINTAIVTTIASEFTKTLEEGGLISSIFMIFVAEIITSNVIQLLDLGGNFKRHYLAPRAESQEKMNGYMMGGEYFIAERYTNVTKILFLALYYATIYPATYFFCSFSLFINYFADRFSIMRTWKQIGKVGPKISRISRRIFCNLAVLIFVMMSAYNWASFPCDNLCESEHLNTAEINVKIETLNKMKNITEIIKIPKNEKIYEFCNQDMLTTRFQFPPLPGKQSKVWMKPEQEQIVTLFGITTIVMLVLCVALYMLRNILQMCRTGGGFEAVGEDQDIPFSTIDSVCAYIPELTSRELSYPLVACRMDTFDHELFEWQNPDVPYEAYDLTKDVAMILKEKEGNENMNEEIFSTIMHWPPEE